MPLKEIVGLQSFLLPVSFPGHEVSSCAPPHTPATMCCLATGPKASGQVWPSIPKAVAIINLHSLQAGGLGICYSVGQLTDTAELCLCWGQCSALQPQLLL
jgi:hypothetical protein